MPCWLRGNRWPKEIHPRPLLPPKTSFESNQVCGKTGNYHSIVSNCDRLVFFVPVESLPKTEIVAPNVPMAVGSLNRRKSLTPAENTSNAPLSVHSTSTASLLNQVSSTNQNAAALESLKQDILATVRAEIQAAKLEILEGMTR